MALYTATESITRNILYPDTVISLKWFILYHLQATYWHEVTVNERVIHFEYAPSTRNILKWRECYFIKSLLFVPSASHILKWSEWYIPNIIHFVPSANEMNDIQHIKFSFSENVLYSIKLINYKNYNVLSQSHYLLVSGSQRITRT